MKVKSCSTLHTPNHNGGGAELDFWVLRRVSLEASSPCPTSD